MHSLNWGSVPEWLGGLSLILALAVFRRDRVKSERSQVEHLGVWADPKYSTATSLPERVDLNFSIRNASDLPMSVDLVKGRVYTEWGIPQNSEGTVLTCAPGGDTQDGVPWPQHPVVKPGETIVDESPVSVLNRAPAGSSRLASVKVVISRIDVTDNAGRRWQIRPKRRKPIRRVRFYHLLIQPPPGLHPWYKDYYNYPRYVLRSPRTVIEHMSIDWQRKHRTFTHAAEYLEWVNESEASIKSADVNATSATEVSSEATHPEDDG